MGLLLLFMYIFSFPVNIFPSYINSMMIVFIITSLKLIFSRKSRERLIKIINTRYILGVFAMLSIVIFYSLLVLLFSQSNDLSFVKVLLHQMFNLIVGIFLFSTFLNVKNIKVNLIQIFIIQSAIQFLSFANETFRNMTNIFRSDFAVSKGQIEYGNIRGLAVSGSAFFGLAVAYGLIFIVLAYSWQEWKVSWINKIIFLSLLIFGAMSAGRSSILGIFFGFLVYIITKIHKKEYRTLEIKKGSFIKTCIFIVFLIIVIFSTPNIINKSEIFNNNLVLKKYIFQALDNYKATGKLETRSTNILFHQMYFPISIRTFLFGDGFYTSNSGSYYMNTDAGYMRNVLYFGIPGIILLLIYQIKLLEWNKYRFLKSLVILLYLMLMHVKGEVLGFMIITQNILLLIGISKINLRMGDLDE